MRVAMEPSAPMSISGFLTFSQSETMPNTMRAAMSAPQNQMLRPLTFEVVKKSPSGLLKVTE